MKKTENFKLGKEGKFFIRKRQENLIGSKNTLQPPFNNPMWKCTADVTWTSFSPDIDLRKLQL